MKGTEKTTRLRKAHCLTCGFIVRVSRAQIARGLPFCGSCNGPGTDPALFGTPGMGPGPRLDCADHWDRDLDPNVDRDAHESAYADQCRRSLKGQQGGLRGRSTTPAGEDRFNERVRMHLVIPTPDPEMKRESAEMPF